MTTAQASGLYTAVLIALVAAVLFIVLPRLLAALKKEKSNG
jgi:hypothetical protein